jgi:hypothetical protein
MRIPQKMWDKYVKKSGDSELARGELLCNEHGFMVYRVADGVLEIAQCYGDGRYWGVEAQRLARIYGCRTIRVYTRRNPQAFLRRWDGLQISHTCLEGVLPDVETGLKLEVQSRG